MGTIAIRGEQHHQLVSGIRDDIIDQDLAGMKLYAADSYQSKLEHGRLRI
jgi:hypothetical protein